jgi:protein SCO1/2
MIFPARKLAIVGVLLALATLFLALVTRGAGQQPVPIGGPFNLASSAGGRLSSKELEGKPFAIFFGFTYCPDICPTTLLELSNVIKDLGAEADAMRFLFVSIDPQRDTPEQLRKYLSSFDPHITGLTGSEAEIAAVAKAYRAYFAKVPTSDGYTMNHSAITYLMGRRGEFVEHIAYQEDNAKQLLKLRKLIGTAN